jgi:uncharacterized protein with NRDE domain
LGITRTGKFAVLTNYRETDTNNAKTPVKGLKSRGAMVTAWLTSSDEETTREFVQRLLSGDGVKNVGGFSLVCGKLRKSADRSIQAVEPLAIISNRAADAKDIPWIADERKQVYGLSNTSYSDPVTWPKVEIGKRLLLEAIKEAVTEESTEDLLIDKLFHVLNTDTLPSREGKTFDESIMELRKSIFIPPIGGKEAATVAAVEDAEPPPKTNGHTHHNGSASETKAEAASNGNAGCYGTQRQTIILVDWDGNVMYVERALWDAAGKPLSLAARDRKFTFKVEGWDG